MNDMAFVKAHIFIEMADGRDADIHGEARLLKVLMAGAAKFGYEVTLSTDHESGIAAILQLESKDSDKAKERKA